MRETDTTYKMGQAKRMYFLNRTLIVVLLTLTLISGFMVSSFFEYDKIDVQLTVSNIIGFNVGTDALYLGAVPPGNSANRMIHIRNDRFLFGRVNIKTEGAPADWLYVSDNNFYLKKDETKDINVRAVVPKDAAYGEYNGTIKVYFFLV